MSDAGAMIACFYGRPEVGPEFPIESAVGAERLPEGMNTEGYVWPELAEVAP